MLRTIVVPLDGSLLAERALPYAEQLAKGSTTRLTLCRVVTNEIIQKGGRDCALADEAGTYLQGVEAGIKARGQTVQSMVDSGDPASRILECARSSEADLIVMATHGRSGPGRWLYGSVADELLRHAPIPVVLVPTTAATPWQPNRPPTVMVTLDGSSLAEAALTPAVDLARRLGSEMILLQVISYPPATAYGAATYLPSFDPTDQLAFAEQYLTEVAEKLKQAVKGIKVLTEVGQAAAVVAEVATRQGAGLIAMATHGRSGLARVVLGSVATGTLQRSRMPLLLVGPAALPTHAPAEAGAVIALTH
jgi:nucleotide-binding universal stress UspA family protein